ncbi:MAG: sigma-70 family RNA polymerase sigma factor [Actinomycetota bacterium]|nr:sigma-70 family RNA polymerase sigma factor [Actinomycetota bacterium]
MDEDFTALYRAQRPRLIGALCAVGAGDVDAATEAVDEAFVRALERWPSLADHPEPAGWVFVTARNQLRRRFRRANHERRLLARFRPDRTEPAPADETWLVVADLPRRQREVVVLRHMAGLTEAAIGEALGISRGTVSSTLRDAYRALSAEVAEPSDAEPATAARTETKGELR